jgi:hypothetical protein
MQFTLVVFFLIFISGCNLNGKSEVIPAQLKDTPVQKGIVVSDFCGDGSSWVCAEDLGGLIWCNGNCPTWI